MRKLSRQLAKGVGHLLLGGSITLILLGVALFAIGAYLVSIPYARMSRKHAQLQAFVQAAQAGAVLLAVLRTPEHEPADPDET